MNKADELEAILHDIETNIHRDDCAELMRLVQVVRYMLSEGTTAGDYGGYNLDVADIVSTTKIVRILKGEEDDGGEGA